VQLSRLSDGTRRLVSLTEITGTEGDTLCMSEIFRFEQQGVDADGKSIGEIVPTGLRPRFLDKLRSQGVKVPLGLFTRDERAAGRR
jgi:pilus assembly protein CpaF